VPDYKLWYELQQCAKYMEGISTSVQRISREAHEYTKPHLGAKENEEHTARQSAICVQACWEYNHYVRKEFAALYKH
jgi:hypothetical protein